MIRGTTPTFTLVIADDSDVDLTQANRVYFTICQGAKIITKSGEQLEVSDGKTVSVFLDQEDSMSLREGQKAEVQLNWTYTGADGKSRRAATPVKEVTIGRQLLKQVIE